MGMKFLAERVQATTVELEHQLVLLEEAAREGSDDLGADLMADRIQNLAADLLAAGGGLRDEVDGLATVATPPDLAAILVRALGATRSTLALDRAISGGFFAWSSRSVFEEISRSNTSGPVWVSRLHDLADQARFTLADVSTQLEVLASGAADLAAVRRCTTSPQLESEGTR